MINIRRFEPTDEKEINNLITGIMNEEFSTDAAAYPTNDLNDIPRTYGGLGEAFFVATGEGDEVVGTVAIKKEDDRVALMRRLFVSTAHRKKKIGVKLIDRALQFCDEVGYQEVVFRTTSKMEGAIGLCQKYGFVQRAKLELDQIELLKFVCSLRNGS